MCFLKLNCFHHSITRNQHKEIYDSYVSLQLLESRPIDQLHRKTVPVLGSSRGYLEFDLDQKKKERIFPQWRTISRGGSRIAPTNRPVIFSVAAPKRRARGEEFGSGTCMHRTGETTRNVNSSLIEMPRKDSPFNRDPNDKFLFPRVISCPRIFVQIRVGWKCRSRTTLPPHYTPYGPLLGSNITV